MWFPEMLYTIDILFIVFVLFFAASGMRHGLSGELAHVVTLLVLLAGFCIFYPQIMQFATGYCHALSETSLQIVVPVVLVVAAVLLFVVMRLLLKQMLKSKVDGTADKIAGGLVGGLRGGLFGLAVFAGLSLIPNDTIYRMLSEKSSIGAWVCNTLTPWAQEHVSDLPVLKEKVEQQIDDAGQRYDEVIPVVNDTVNETLDDLSTRYDEVRQ